MAPTLDNNTSCSTSLSFQKMLDGIRSAFSRSDSMVDVDELWRVLENYQSNPADWAKYAYYDFRKYKRNLVDEHEKYNIMILCWGPSTKSSIHDHSGSHCFMKNLDGELHESRFAWPDGEGNDGRGMKLLSESRMGVNDVLYINDKVGLHRVVNPSANKTSASLHVYVPPYRECKAFDERTGQSRDCKLTFYSKCGKLTKDEEENVTGCC